ncbi:MAG: hypothetical protein ABJG78_01200 [Cyclobacteriaceae bacterium]
MSRIGSAWRVAILAVFFFSVLNSTLYAQEEGITREFSGNVSLENRFFLNDGIYQGQHRNYLSMSFTPEYLVEWKEGKKSIKFIGFARVDQYDSKRTHFDIRELYYQVVKTDWELSIGLKKIFWGVTESAHLVDIINQTDVVESFDGEQKLGQPMVHFSYLSTVGTFDLFAMPYFRKRQFPGREGRLRPAFLIDKGDFTFESSAEEYRPDFAIRWSHFVGAFDIGLSHFYGTGREQFFSPNADGSIDIFYGIINQTGLDVQATTGPILWKLEGILRESDFQDMKALATGIEYTFGNVWNSGIDIGLVGEYLYDDRDNLAFSSLQDDLFFATRLAFNDTQDTQILLGGIFDRERSSELISLEGSRRFGSSWKGVIEARLLNDIDTKEFIYFVREDSFLQFSLAKYF